MISSLAPKATPVSPTLDDI